MGIATGPSIDTVRHQITIPGTSFCAVVHPDRVDVEKLVKKLATASGLRATRKADRDRMPVVTVLQPGDVAAPAQDTTTDTATAVPASQLTPWRATYSRKSLEESVTALRSAYPYEFEYEELDGVEDDVADVAAPAQDVAADVPAPEPAPRRPRSLGDVAAEMMLAAAAKRAADDVEDTADRVEVAAPETTPRPAVRSREQVAAEMHARTMERAAKEAQRCAAEAEERAVAAEARAAEAVRRAEALELELRCADDAPAVPAAELADAIARAEAAEARADALAAELATVCAEAADDVERAAAEAGARAEAEAAEAWAVAVAGAEERAAAAEDRMRAAEARAVALRDAAEDAERAAADAVERLQVRAGRRAAKRARMAARPVAPAAPVVEDAAAPVAPVAPAPVEDVAPAALVVAPAVEVPELEVAPAAPVVEVEAVAPRPVVARLGRVLGLLVVLVVVGAWAAVAVVARAVRAAATREADLEAARGVAPVVATRPVPVAVAARGGAPVAAAVAPRWRVALAWRPVPRPSWRRGVTRGALRPSALRSGGRWGTGAPVARAAVAGGVAPSWRPVPVAVAPTSCPGVRPGGRWRRGGRCGGGASRRVPVAPSWRRGVPVALSCRGVRVAVAPRPGGGGGGAPVAVAGGGREDLRHRVERPAVSCRCWRPQVAAFRPRPHGPFVDVDVGGP